MSDLPQYGRNSFEEGGTESDHPSIRSLTFDAEERAYVARFDNSDALPSTIVVSVITEITGQSLTDLRPLYHVVDPDALDQIVGNRPSGLHHSERLVEFTYQDFNIRLLSSGVIKVCLPST
ncbi:HalOD1 output domain-containing protein [Salinibaculum salinum]|uniref:HalOD1 output domain-containing protein n=1 Tax=Salinibaculum salinum TaxID=3131996 RepID=UPI003A96FC33